MTHFWASSGHLLLDREPGGGLVVTDDFLKAYLARPEVLPPDEACAAERALHGKLMAQPQAEVAEREIAAIADADGGIGPTRPINAKQRLKRRTIPADIGSAHIAQSPVPRRSGTLNGN